MMVDGGSGGRGGGCWEVDKILIILIIVPDP